MWWTVGSAAAVLVVAAIVASIVFAPAPPPTYTAGGTGAEIEGGETFENETSDLDMRKVAEGFRPGPERPVTMAYRIGYVPADYRLVGISGPHRNVLFEHADRAAARPRRHAGGT